MSLGIQASDTSSNGQQQAPTHPLNLIFAVVRALQRFNRRRGFEELITEVGRQPHPPLRRVGLPRAGAAVACVELLESRLDLRIAVALSNLAQRHKYLAILVDEVDWAREQRVKRIKSVLYALRTHAP